MATAETVFRDFVTDGVPASGANKPKKREIRALLAAYETIINAFTSNGGLVFPTLSSLEAELDYPARTMAWVIGDDTVANNGIYRKLGSSGSGSWERMADLPYNVIRASDAGAGGANSIDATTSIPISDSALVMMNVFETNTGSPVYVSFNGSANYRIVTSSGNDVVAGGLVSGSWIYGVISGDTFRLANDEAVASLIAANRTGAETARTGAETARAAAEAARDIAAGYAADAVSQGNVPVYSTTAAVSALTVPVGINAIRVNGNAAVGDLGGTHEGIATREASEPTYGPKFQDASGVWFYIKAPKLDLRQFGAFGSDNEDAVPVETTAIHDAIKRATAEGLELKVPAAHYSFDQLLLITSARKRTYIVGDGGGRPVFHVPQSVADSTGSAGRFIQIGRGNYGDAVGDITGLTLATAITPGQRRIKLTDVSGIKPGMLLQITSNRLWYYDHRDQYYCSEMHLVSKVIEATDEVIIDDFTRDTYTPGVDTLYIRAIELDEGEVSNIAIKFPTATTPAASTRGLMFDRTANLRINDVLIEGCTGAGALAISRAWRPHIHNYEVGGGGVRLDAATTIGYGMSANSWYGGLVTGLKSRGMRRSIDFDTVSSAQIQSVTRDTLVRDFVITGGNATAAPAEILSDPGFDNAAAWNVPANWAVSGGKATRTAGVAGNITGNIAGMVPGEVADFTLDIESISGGGLRISFYEDATPLAGSSSLFTTPGVHTVSLTIPASANRIGLRSDVNGVAAVVRSLSMEALSFWYPDGDAPNYGIGGHGAVEGVQFRDGVISDVETGINVRYRDTIISGVQFRDRMQYCIVATFGTGLEVRDCNYRRSDYPNKVDSATAYGATQFAKLPDHFLKIGISTGTGDWNYESPVIVEGNVAHGLKKGFVGFGESSTKQIKNLYVRNNSVLVALPAAETFEFYNVVGAGTVRMNSSFLDAGTNYMHDQANAGGTLKMYPGSDNFILGNVSFAGSSSAVKIGDRKWACVLNDDAAVRFPGMATQGDRVTVVVTAHQGNAYGMFMIDQAGTLTALGTIGADLAGSSTSPLTGTTGTDGKVTVSANVNGDVFIENRAGAARRFVVEFI
jgi:hypothetical protein